MSWRYSQVPSKGDQQLSVGDYEDFHGSPDGRAKIAIKSPTTTDVAEVNANKEVLVHDNDLILAVNNASTGGVDPANVHTASSGSISAADAGTDNPIILLKNPNGSGKSLRFIYRVYSVEVVNVYGVFSMYLDPTITNNGTSATISNGRQTGAVATVATAFTLPTLSALGTKIDEVVTQQNNSPSFMPDDGSFILDPNHNIVITANPASNNRAVRIGIKWSEV